MIVNSQIPANHSRLRWEAQASTANHLAIAGVAKQTQRPILLICRDNQQAEQCAAEIAFFREGDWPIQVFPDWETLPYDQFSPHEDITSTRLKTLNQLKLQQRGVTVIAIQTLMHRLPPTDFIQGQSFSLNVGDQLDPQALRERLVHSGYHPVAQVMEHGECALRGSIIDIFPMGSEQPFRLDLFDEEIESIRYFDPETQRSQQSVTGIHCLPAHEFPLTEAAITLFRRSWRQQFSGNPSICPLYEDVSEGIAPPGIEYYLPLFFSATATLIDYLPENAIIIRQQDCSTMADQFWQEVNQRHEQRNYDITRPILPPTQVFIPTAEIFGLTNAFAQIDLSEISESDFPDLSIDHRKQNPLHALSNYLNQHSRKTVLIAESAGRRETLKESLQQAHLQAQHCEQWQDVIQSCAALNIVIGPLNYGAHLAELDIITEAQLFGEKVISQRRQTRTIDPDVIVRDLSELRIGSPVVHLEHGVGRYQGLHHLDIDGVRSEFLHLEYAGGDKIYVPVTSLHMISRYTGGDLDQAPLHRLGHDQWSKAKRKAAEKINDVAAELLDVYAQRAARKGFQYAKPDAQYQAFADAFQFSETDDQLRAIDQIISDMTSTQPMDRLICGDVGFGKTEVAMRAAFLAVQNQKQVVILTPTTLLAGQHYENFTDRLADFAVNVELLTRFRTAKQQQTVIDKLGNGNVDIVIGTHKLIQKGIKFANLGLVIIDEEHRFGVKQKEHLKTMRHNVDILALTATPIPRTLNMAMGGLRDISLIATPPARRLSIKTFWQQKSTSLIREALLREILRGGQVYFLHNNIDTIQRMAEEISEIVPEAKVRIAHGQMRERELENVMSDFHHRRFNVLVCTTIIETGIDIPSANTVIIDRADHFGLAQLHQIRGRVGRSHHQAYAYLLTPPAKSLNKDAVKRLEAITSLEDLGAGFTLATHDLEIRGAGELLGEEQSGNMQAIGFTLYMDLLDRAVKALQSGQQPELLKPLDSGPEIDCHISALLPDEYIPDVHLRLTQYKRIANAANKEVLKDLQAEMIDRFGLLPDPVKHLFRITELKLQAAAMHIEKIDANAKRIKLTIAENTTIDPSRIIHLIQMQPSTYQLVSATALQASLASETAIERLDNIQQVLQTLNASSG